MDPYSAPSIDAVAASRPISREEWDRGLSTHDLEEVPFDLEASMEPATERVAAPVVEEAEEERGGIGWLAPLVFVLGLLIALFGAFCAIVASAVVGVAAGLWLVMAAPGTSDADFILVPDTLPVQGAEDRSDAEFILVPDTLPVQQDEDRSDAEFIVVPDTLPVKQQAAPRTRRVEAKRAAPSPQKAKAEPKGNAADVSLEAVPLDEAVRRVKGKAGRGEARSTRGH